MFFEPKSYKERSPDMATFREWAGSIANSYLNGGVLPTASLTKIAQSEELTPHHIEVLAAEANKEIHRIKYASATDKYFAADFPLANAREVIGKLQVDGGTEKVAVRIPDPVFQPKEVDMYKMWGIEPEPVDKTASLRPQLRSAAERCEVLARGYEDKAILSKFSADAAAEKFIKLARQFVNQEENPSDRMKALGKLDHFVKSAEMLEGRQLLAKVAYILGREGKITPAQTKVAFNYFIKEADMKAPEELISSWLPAQIVNGEHPLYITLKLHKDCKKSFSDNYDRHKLIEDRLGTIHQKVRAL